MFWFKSILLFVVLALVLTVGGALQRHLSTMPSSRPGVIMPIVSAGAAIILSIPNFMISVSTTISWYAFAAALALFVIYAFPAVYFGNIYMEERKRLETRNRIRLEKNRKVRREVTYKRMNPMPPEKE